MPFTKDEALQIAHIDLAKGKLSEAEVLGWLWDVAFNEGGLDGGDAGYQTGLADARAENRPLSMVGYLAASPELAEYVAEKYRFVNPDDLAQGNHD